MKLKNFLNESEEDWRAIENNELNYSFYVRLDIDGANFSFSRSPDYKIKTGYRDAYKELYKIKDKEALEKAWAEFDKLEREHSAEVGQRRKKLVTEIQHMLDTVFALIKGKLQHTAIEIDKITKKNVDKAMKNK